MNERRLLRLRSLLGWAATAMCLCAGLALADSFLDSSRTGPNTYDLLPGGVENLSGTLPPDVDDPTTLRVTIDHPGLFFDFTTTARGHWLGNRLWQGRVRAGADAAPGTASLTLRAPGDDASGRMQAFTIRIFPDMAALDAASNSSIRRLFGFSPAAATVYCVIAAALAGLLVYMVSSRLEALWTRQGKAVVYMTKKTPDGLLISFGLGARQGLSPGASVSVSDESGLPVAVASVVRCSVGDAVALVVGEGRVGLGNIVMLAGPVASRAERLPS